MKLQQGDVILRTIDAMPENAELANTQVVKDGINNHIISNGSKVFKTKDKTFVSVEEASVLSHPEHGPINVPQGVYSVTIKKEYFHMDEEAREVID